MERVHTFLEQGKKSNLKKIRRKIKERRERKNKTHINFLSQTSWK